MLRLKIDGDQNEETVSVDTLNIAEQISKTKILNRKDVTILCLNNRNIRNICSLEIFPNLMSLTIDGNRLENLKFLHRNFSLGELYASNNHLANIRGSLSPLTNLKILHLQNNQISNLENLAYELRHLTALEDLNLFDNPVTFVSGYKSTIIDLLPNLRVLDRKTISNEDRARAFKTRHPDRQQVLARFGFNRHIEEKSQQNSTKQIEKILPKKSSIKPSVKIQENSIRQNSAEQTLSEALRNRAFRRSLTEYSQFDWNKIPTGAERRLMEAENEVTQPDVISIFFQ